MLRIKDWDKHFENNRTRDLKKLEWVPIPNRMDGDGYTDLLDHENGAAHLGAWLAIVQIASKCDARGTLSREAVRPHDYRSLARMSRVSEAVFSEAIPRLLGIGWLEVVPDNALPIQQDTPIPQDDAVQPQEPAVIPQDGAPRARAQGMEGNGREWKGMEPQEGAPLPQTPVDNPTERAVTRETVPSSPDLWDAYFGMFESSGKPLNETDQRKACAAFISLAESERISAHDHAAKCFRDGTWPAPELTPYPANHLAGRPWTRTAKPRTLPDAPRGPTGGNGGGGITETIQRAKELARRKAEQNAGH